MFLAPLVCERGILGLCYAAAYGNKLEYDSIATFSDGMMLRIIYYLLGHWAASAVLLVYFERVMPRGQNGGVPSHPLFFLSPLARRSRGLLRRLGLHGAGDGGGGGDGDGDGDGDAEAASTTLALKAADELAETEALAGGFVEVRWN